jgi:hypothetical protein
MFTTRTKIENKWSVGQAPHGETYLPSPLVLVMVLENGWRVINVELAPSQDQLGLVYLVTLKSDSRQQIQQIMLPRTDLIEKLLEENLSLEFPIKLRQPDEEWLLTV